MAWFATNIASSFLIESIRVSKFEFIIRVLSFMIVPFRVGLNQVFLSGHLFCFGCLLLFPICIFNDDVSD